jgi:helicase
MDIKDLTLYGASGQLANVLLSIGIGHLTPPQELAVKAGLLEGKDSFVVAAPTASGKTLIAEMAFIKSFLERSGKAVYLVPLRALAREKYEDFKKKYDKAGMRVTMSTGDYDSSEPWLNASDLIICTNEKMDSLVRHRISWLKDVKLVIADEIHLIGDGGRGPTLEVVLTRLKDMNPDLKVIALSATIPNAPEIADWLGARLIQSDWRPVPLREGVYFDRAVIFNDGVIKWIKEESKSDEIDLALETINEGGQALIFLSTRKSTEASAKKASGFIANTLDDEDKKILKGLSESVLRSSSEPTRMCKKLADYVSMGVAFHHAGINYTQRKLIEDAFRANKIKLIASTTTLAMGLNLPSRRVIIRDWFRYESGLGMRPIPAIEIKQMSGRAGRPGFDDYGEAVIIAKNKRDERHLFDRYIKGGPENIESALANEDSLRTHILASVAGSFTRNRADLREFLQGTFSAHQRGVDYLFSIADSIMEFLEQEGMITIKGEGISATRFGRRVSELYIDPLSGVVLRDALSLPIKKDTFPLLHVITRTPDMMRLSFKKSDFEEMLDVFYAHSGGLLIKEDEKYPSEEILSELKTASALMQWILESHEDKIVGHFGIGPGDLRTMVDLAEWLIYSAHEIGKVLGLDDALKSLSLLRLRILYGIKDELLELVGLKGIGRIRARNLFNTGYKTLETIKSADINALASVPSIGEAIAEAIKKQV